MLYICSVCGYVYDEGKQGSFAQFPDTWKCPVCGADKAAFAPKEEKAPQKEAAAVKIEPLCELNAGELSVAFSNLARGCEKQYRPREQQAFSELAAYFAQRIPAVPEGSLDRLEALIAENLREDYLASRNAAVEQGDRGTQRICVWGEKVTRMLELLLKRYRQEGEAMLEHTRIWVCSVCGFVYIGDEPPKNCPVCKVPDWKFERIFGRDAE